MPIQLPFPIRNLTPAEFDEVDRVVMPLAYATQNALGRLCDERVYENKLSALLRAAGVGGIFTQVPVIVRHDGFEKTYRLDLLAGHAIYELKTVQRFVPQHEAQVLHYAMLADVNHIKLLNFRAPKVRGLLHFNAVLSPARHSPQWHDVLWQAMTPRCRELRQRVEDLVANWGSHLDFRLYEEALVCLLGGEAACVQRVPVVHQGQELGTHCLNSHADGLAFVVTAFPRPERQTEHLERLRELTRRRAVQWINFDKHDIHLVTVV